MLDLLHAIASGSAIFLAFLVLTVRHDVNVIANRWLAVFLLLLGLFMIDDSLLIYDIYPQIPWLIGVLGLPLFALAPAIYLSILQFVEPGRKFWAKDLVHFVPTLVYVFLGLPFFFGADVAMKIQVLEKIESPSTPAEQIILSLIFVQIGAYLFFAFRKLQQHRRNLEKITASPEGINLSWLQYFLGGICLMVVAWFVETFLLPYQPNAGSYTPVYFVSIYVMGYFSLRQKEVFPYSKQETSAVSELLEDKQPAPLSRKPLFQVERLEQLRAELEETMAVKKAYLEPELSLPELSRMMALSVHETSELVNAGFGENFSQFVNRYRVEESKRLLLSREHAHLSMVGIAFEAGFNSKTAFNTAFKKFEGTTPGEYRALQRRQAVSV